MATTPEPTSIWLARTPRTRFSPLSGDVTGDVAVIGGGISGITAAALLKSAGRRVIVVEQTHLGAGETGHTTAHLTEQLDRPYRDLAEQIGSEATRLVAEGTREAIDLIETLVTSRHIDCGFERVDGFLYAERQEDLASLSDELDAANRAGIAVSSSREVPLPFQTFGGIRFARQAEIEPLAYIHGLSREIAGEGSHIFEGTRVLNVAGDSACRIETATGTVTADDVLVLTHAPIDPSMLPGIRLVPIRSHVIAAEFDGHRLPHSLFWDTAYHYVRTWANANRTFLIVGGEDIVCPADGADQAFETLETYARARFPIGPIGYRWSGRVLETGRGIPVIGASARSPHVYVATGYSGNGLTFGTLAAMILRDLVLGRANRYAELYDPAQTNLEGSGVPGFRGSGVQMPEGLPQQMVEAPPDVRPAADQRAELDRIPPGEGAVLTIDGRRYAVYRDDRNGLHALSPECPHVYCEVIWNGRDKRWDCPCHGSRFAPTGRVLQGPAMEGLAPMNLPRLG